MENNFEYFTTKADRILAPYVNELDKAIENNDSGKINYYLISMLMYHSGIQRELKQVLEDKKGEHGYRLTRIIKDERLVLKLINENEINEFLLMSREFYNQMNCMLRHLK